MQSVASLIQPVRRRLGVRYVIDRGIDHRSAIFLAGTARSGTTWVSELINYRNEYRYIFEPFNHKKVAAAVPFGSRRYMRPDETNTVLLDIANSILSGKMRSRWTERFNRRVVCDQRLVKCIRANLMLKWLHVNFPGMPVVLVLRHPCAVAHSYAKHGWGGAVEPLLAQETLIQDFLKQHTATIAQARGSFERAVCIWCIENLVALKQFKPGEAHVVFYEHLLLQPEIEVRRLFAFLAKPYDTTVIERITRPSLTSRKDSAVRMGEGAIGNWRGKVSDEQLRWTLDTVREFGLDTIYSDAPMPHAQGLQAVMNA